MNARKISTDNIIPGRYYVTFRIEEITVAEWVALYGRPYLQSGDPTRAVYGVAFCIDYHTQRTVFSDISEDEAWKFVDHMNNALTKKAPN